MGLGGEMEASVSSESGRECCESQLLAGSVQEAETISATPAHHGYGVRRQLLISSALVWSSPLEPGHPKWPEGGKRG
jgi:hypothetical protein